MTVTTETIKFKGTNLFKPFKLGDIELSHRVVLAPLTRLRNDPKTYAPNVKAASLYYSQRSEKPGSLLVLEGFVINEKGGSGTPGFPGFWSEEQVEAWTQIIDTIHQNKSFAVVQLVSFGRQGHGDGLAKLGFDYVAPSVVYVDERFKEAAEKSNNPLRALTTEEVKNYVEEFIFAAKNAIRAGADGVQIHAANGYLLNEFLDPLTNQRTDEYGGSIENRSRLLLEIVDRLIEEFGSSKVSVRLSPYGIFQGLKGISQDPTLLAQYAHLVGELEVRAQQGNRLQFIDLVEPRDIERVTEDSTEEIKINGTNEFISTIWKGPIVKAGNFGNNYDAILKEIEDDRTLIAFGRHYISNPDLPDRLENGYPLTKYNRATFYTSDLVEGYTDYPRYH